MVLAHHFVPASSIASPNALVRTWAAVASLGAGGVDLFFVLSGFLITGILLDAKGTAGYFRNFYARRVLRIFPLYYAVLIACFVFLPRLHRASSDEQAVAQGQAWLWTYASNVFDGRFPDWRLTGGWLSFDHFWSLCVEEHFYFVWPLAVYALGRRGLALCCVAIIAAAPALRWALYARHDPTLAFYVWTPCRMDGLAAGALLALFARSPQVGAKVRPAAWLALAIACPWIALTADHPARPYVYATSQVTLVAAALIVLAVTATPRGAMSRALSARPLTFFGKYSYAIYVLHLFLLRTVIDRVMATRPIRDHVDPAGACHLALLLGLGLATSAAAGWLSWHVFEKHFLKLKRYFQYSSPSHRASTLASRIVRPL